MSKIILNGTNGITGYEADNTTVNTTVSISSLHGEKPDVFLSSSSLQIQGKVTADALATPALLRYFSGSSRKLAQVFSTTTNFETFTSPDTTHTMMSDIQAGDLLVILEIGVLDTSQGYGFSVQTPSGWTFLNQGSWYYKPSLYSVAYAWIHYKLAAGNESNTNVSPFMHNGSAYGTVRGNRFLARFRPLFSHSNNVTATSDIDVGTAGTASVPAHTRVSTLTPSSTDPTAAVAFFGGSQASQTGTLSGSVSSFESSNTGGYGTGSIRSTHSGSFTLPAGAAAVSMSGPANTTSQDATGIWAFTLT